MLGLETERLCVVLKKGGACEVFLATQKSEGAKERTNEIQGGKNKMYLVLCPMDDG